MADISAIKTPDGTSYNIKDATARSDISGKQDAISDISKSGSTYSGGLADEKLLTTATINKWKTILGIS